MKTRFLLLFLFVTACFLFLELFFWHSYRGVSPTLIDLASLDIPALLSDRKFAEITGLVRDGEAWITAMGIDSLVYGAVGIFGVLLLLRALASALRRAKAKPSSKTRELAAPSPVAARAGTAVGSTGNLTAAPQARFPAYGLAGKLLVGFTGIVVMFGLLTLTLVYIALSSSLKKYAIERARLTAVNVSDSAPAYVLRQDAAALRQLLRQQANRPEIAYILVQNHAGEILTQNLAAWPRQERRYSPAGNPAGGERTRKAGREAVYEVTVPILEGQLGVVRLGIWRAEVDAEIRRTVMPLAGLLLFVVSGGVLVAVILVWRINSPILKLVGVARSISRGALDTPSLGVEDPTEFGDLSRALERMRSSVRAAMSRLRSER